MRIRTIRNIMGIMLIIILFSCKMTNNSQIADQHKEISSILDSALLCDDPLGKFNEVLPKIREFSAVDSAWILDLSFFVKYKEGGTVSWDLSPHDLK